MTPPREFSVGVVLHSAGCYNFSMSKTEITAQALTDIITAAGHSPRDFDIKATLKNVTRYNKEMALEIADGGHPDEFSPVDMETVMEWLDETSTFATYVLCPWLSAA